MDFTNEVPPKFEILPDRIEISSAGVLPDGLSQKEFFLGFSVPRNKELMSIFKDLGIVEQLGSGVPRILESYDKICFVFSDNFLRMIFSAQREITPQVTRQIKRLILIIRGGMTRQERQDSLALADRMNFLNTYQRPAIESGLIELKFPGKLKSLNQIYRLTKLGEEMKLELILTNISGHVMEMN